jgi:hypothetical protein
MSGVMSAVRRVVFASACGRNHPDEDASRAQAIDRQRHGAAAWVA